MIKIEQQYVHKYAHYFLDLNLQQEVLSRLMK